MLSKRDLQKVVERLTLTWSSSLPRSKVKGMKKVEIDDKQSLLISDTFTVVGLGEILLPFLGDEEHLKVFPHVVIDSGAIPYVCNGADIMRPGIVNFSRIFEKGNIVVVQEEKYQKYIAVGLALLDSSEATVINKGPVIKNLHFIGDKFWEAFKNIRI